MTTTAISRTAKSPTTSKRYPLAGRWGSSKFRTRLGVIGFSLWTAPEIHQVGEWTRTLDARARSARRNFPGRPECTYTVRRLQVAQPLVS